MFVGQVEWDIADTEGGLWDLENGGAFAVV